MFCIPDLSGLSVVLDWEWALGQEYFGHCTRAFLEAKKEEIITTIYSVTLDLRVEEYREWNGIVKIVGSLWP